MSRKIIGITVGTPMSPQVVLDRLGNIGGDGSTVILTKEEIINILGYTPADQIDVNQLSEQIANLMGEINEVAELVDEALELVGGAS